MVAPIRVPGTGAGSVLVSKSVYRESYRKLTRHNYRDKSCKVPTERPVVSHTIQPTTRIHQAIQPFEFCQPTVIPTYLFVQPTQSNWGCTFESNNFESTSKENVKNILVIGMLLEWNCQSLPTSLFIVCLFRVGFWCLCVLRAFLVCFHLNYSGCLAVCLFAFILLCSKINKPNPANKDNNNINQTFACPPMKNEKEKKCHVLTTQATTITSWSGTEFEKFANFSQVSTLLAANSLEAETCVYGA